MKLRKIVIGFVVSFVMTLIIVRLVFNQSAAWQNFWNFWAGISSAVVAIAVFIKTLEVDNRNDEEKENDEKSRRKEIDEKERKKDEQIAKENRIEDYLSFQDEITKNVANKLLHFNKELRLDEETIDKKISLSEDLVDLLFMIEKANKKRMIVEDISQQINTNLYEDFDDFSQLDSSLNTVLNASENTSIKEIVIQTYPDLKEKIEARSKGSKEEIESEFNGSMEGSGSQFNSSQNKNHGDRNNDILSDWYLNLGVRNKLNI